MLKINSFSVTQQKNWLEKFGYCSVLGLQSFPPLATRLGDFARVYRHRKVVNNYKFAFRLNCK